MTHSHGPCPYQHTAVCQFTEWDTAMMMLAMQCKSWKNAWVLHFSGSAYPLQEVSVHYFLVIMHIVCVNTQDKDGLICCHGTSVSAQCVSVCVYACMCTYMPACTCAPFSLSCVSAQCVSDWLMIAYIALFSALLSRLTVLACGSTWVTSFIVRFCSWISTEVVYLQRWHGWCHMKLQPSQCKSCVHHTTMHHVTSCKATYIRCMRV